MNAGASLSAVPSPIEGSGTAWVLLGSWALSPARPTPIPPRHECRGFSALLVTGKMLDYTVHMYSSQEHTSARRRRATRQAKWHAPHPPWRWLLATASASPCRRRQRDTEAPLSPRGGVPGVRSRRHRGKNTV